MNAKNAANSTLGRPNAISTNAGERRSSILNYGHFPNSTLVSEHFSQADHHINEVLLIPFELSNRDSVRKAREAHLTDKAMYLEPHGINRRDELS